MPIILFTNDDQKAIYLLDDNELVTFQTLHSQQSIIQDIKDCPSSALAGLYVYENLVRIESPWPLDNQPFSDALLQKIAPWIADEQRSMLDQQAPSEKSIDYDLGCPRTYLPVCQDREFIVMLLRKGNQRDFKDYVEKPNKMHQWHIPCVPVCHVTMGTFDVAVSECLSEHADIRWHRTATGSYERVITEHPNHTLSWLQTADDFYYKIVLPHLRMVQTIHDHHTNHGDISDANIVLSEGFGQTFFIDFVTHDTTLYVSEDDKKENEYEYYCWHTERLYDLAYLAYAIQNLANIYLPNAKTNDSIVQYFSDLGENLEEMVDLHFVLANDHDFKPEDIERIKSLKDHTIATISLAVHTLYAKRTELSSAMQAPVNNPENLVRKFSIYKEGDSIEQEESTTPNNNKRQTLGSRTGFV